jgi:LysM repeat protein
MDTISRENTSMLPIGGAIAGVLGLVLGAYAAFVAVPKANKTLAEQAAKIEKIDAIESTANTAAADAAKANHDVAARSKETNDAFKTVSDFLTSIQASITKLEDAQKKPAHAGATAAGGAHATSTEPPVAGPDEYIVKPGDTSGAKIARDHNVSLPDLMAVNPSVNWNKLKVGDKLKIPQKK